MPSFFSKLARFAASPQGRRMITQAKEFAADPRRQAQAKDAIAKLRDRAANNGRAQPGEPPRDRGPAQS
ncbi:MAG: hypothetical protein ACRDQ7_00150 [Haloechinothrix sp.]